MVGPGLNLVHQRIRIVVKDNGTTRSFPSRIEDVVGSRLVVAMPMEKAEYVSFPRGQPVTVYLDSHAASYRYFETEVTGANRDGAPVLLLRLPDEIKSVERRQYTRADVQLVPRRFSLLEGGGQKRVPVTIMNLSGGGLMFQHPAPIPQGAHFETVFELPRGFGVVEAAGQVVRSEKHGDDKSPIYGMGAAFTSIRYSQRENIIKFVLNQQAQFIRQGAI